MVVGAGVSQFDELVGTMRDYEDYWNEETALEHLLDGADLNPYRKNAFSYVTGLKSTNSDGVRLVAGCILRHRARGQ